MDKWVTKLMEDLYMAWTVAAKDLTDVWKFKTTRMNIIAALGLVVFSTWGAANRFGASYLFAEVVLHEEGNSQLSMEMENSPDFEVSLASSLEEMMRQVDSNDIGLVIPRNFDQELNSRGEATINGYISWAKRRDASELELEFSQRISELLEKPVKVAIGDKLVIPQFNSRGASLDVATTMLLALFWIAITVMPRVMLEEKRTKTMEALLVSPASERQVVAGKALLGLFYTVVTAGVALVLNWHHVTNWGLNLLAFLTSSLLAISIALLLGTLVNSDQHLTLWIVPVIVAVVMPAILLQFADGLPPSLSVVLPWIPSAAVVNAFRYTYSNGTSMGQFALAMTVMFVAAALFYGLVIWKLRRADR